jgi:hypothetical protein
MSDATPLPEPWLQRHQLFEFQVLSDEQILAAYHACFTSPAGSIVLRHLYEGLCIGDMDSLLACGRVQVFQGIIEQLRRYEIWQQSQRYHDTGPGASPA